MTRPRVYKTEAIVLKRSSLGEADCLVTLYTRDMGKMKAVAKGIKKPKSKLGGHLEPLTQIALVLSQGQNLDVITQGQTVEPFLPLRDDLWRTSCALYIAELVDKFSREEQENLPVYELLRSTLLWLCDATNIDLALRYFELHLLSCLGYRPELYQCLNCRKKVDPVNNLFSISGGGVLCPACPGAETVVQPVSVDALKVMRYLLSADQTTARRLKTGPDLSDEVERLLRKYVRYLLEREVKSVEFLEQLRRSPYFQRSTVQGTGSRE